MQLKCSYFLTTYLFEHTGSSWNTPTSSTNVGGGSVRRKACTAFKKILPIFVRRHMQRSDRATREPVYNSILTRKACTAEIRAGRPPIIFDSLRMNHQTFNALHNLMVQRGLLQRSATVDVDEQLMIFLWIIAQDGTFRQAQMHWQHSGETIHRHFHNVLKAILSLKEELITPPNYFQVQQLILQHPEKYHP